MTFHYKNILLTITVLLVGSNADAANQCPHPDYSMEGPLPGAKALGIKYTESGLPGAIGLSMGKLYGIRASAQTYSGTTDDTDGGLVAPGFLGSLPGLARTISDVSQLSEDTRGCTAASGAQSGVEECLSVYRSQTTGGHASLFSLASPPRVGGERPALPDSFASGGLGRSCSDTGSKRSSITPVLFTSPSMPTHSVGIVSPTAVLALAAPRRIFDSILPHMRTDDMARPPHSAHLVAGAYHEAVGHQFP